MTATDDLATLLAAINAGDDAALPALADWMEENGDQRAVGMRVIARACEQGEEDAYGRRPTPHPDCRCGGIGGCRPGVRLGGCRPGVRHRPVHAPAEYYWRADRERQWRPNWLAQALAWEVWVSVYQNLPGGREEREEREGHGGHVVERYYPTRSAAYLALAEALS